MALDRFRMPEETWKRAAIGGLGGGLGFYVALFTVGGDDSLRLAVVTAVAALVVMVVVTAAVNS